jgi:hypothetical protein
MNKFLATLFAGAFALTLGSSVFAADAAKPAEAVKATATKAVEPVKAEAAKVAEPAKVVPVKKHVKKAKKAAKAAPSDSAAAALTGK